jgi:hypothetical protein
MTSRAAATSTFNSAKPTRTSRQLRSRLDVRSADGPGAFFFRIDGVMPISLYGNALALSGVQICYGNHRADFHHRGRRGDIRPDRRRSGSRGRDSRR